MHSPRTLPPLPSIPDPVTHPTLASPTASAAADPADQRTARSRPHRIIGATLLGAALLLPLSVPVGAHAHPGTGTTPAAAPDAAASASVDRLAVSVVGDGSTTSSAAVPVSILLTDGTGDDSATIALPTQPSASGQHALTLGASADQQGAIQQSADHSVVTIGGYNAAPGTASLNGTAAPGVLRVVGSLNAAGTVDTSTSLADAYSARHIRGVVSTDGSTFFTGGHGHDAPTTKGGVLSVPLGGSAPTAVVSGSSALNNARVPVINDGSLYVSSDRDGYNGINRVGTLTGSTVDAPVQLTPIASAPEGAAVAHDFAFVDDALYVGYTEGASAGIVKYTNGQNGWQPVGTHSGTFWGLTARAAGDSTVVYAVKGSAQGNSLVRILDDGADSALSASETVISVAEPGTAYRGVAFAPGYEPEDTPIAPDLPTPDLTWEPRVSQGSGGALGAVVGGSANPTARGTVSDPEGRDVTLTAHSADQSVLPDDAITLTRTDDGHFTLAAEPLTAGATRVTVTATATTESAGESSPAASPSTTPAAAVDAAAVADDTASTQLHLDYRVIAEPADSTATIQFGMSDASAAVDAGDGYVLVADDDSNAIRLFSPSGGEPVTEFEIDDAVPPIQSGEAHDFEAQARVGNTVYWLGSLGNSRSGNIRPDRDVIVQSTVSGTGADTTLEVTGYRHGLRQALVDWDHSNAHGRGADHFGFTAATQPGASAEGPNSLNLEGAAMAPDGSTLWLGFRSPLSTGDQALIIPVADISGVIDGAAAQIGEPILLDLDGRAIRDIIGAGDGSYLLLAGR
ncbi:MAG: hypothetical protein ACTJHU_08995, partial [Mycetocola sp.]